MVTEVGYAARFPVTHGYRNRLRSSVSGYVWLRNLVPGHAWLRKSGKQPGSQLRMVTQVGYAARFPVTSGYESRLRNPVSGYVSRLHNLVPGHVWLRKSVTQLDFR